MILIISLSLKDMPTMTRRRVDITIIMDGKNTRRTRKTTKMTIATMKTNTKTNTKARIETLIKATKRATIKMIVKKKAARRSIRKKRKMIMMKVDNVITLKTIPFYTLTIMISGPLVMSLMVNTVIYLLQK